MTMPARLMTCHTWKTAPSIFALVGLHAPAHDACEVMDTIRDHYKYVSLHNKRAAGIVDLGNGQRYNREQYIMLRLMERQGNISKGQADILRRIRKMIKASAPYHYANHDRFACV